MRATVDWLGDVRFEGRSESGHHVAIDGPPELGGQNQGIRPMELMLLGVGGCTSFDVVNILRRGRENLVECSTEIEADRADNDPKVFTRIHFHFRVTGLGLNARKVERAIHLTAEKYCSASIMLERAGVAVTHDYELIEA
ncbi:MAG: OsmC family protein [Gammaproteobacteria bacterium]|nr:OsmC family protein [Gammaproteobacteria bacterium]